MVVTIKEEGTGAPVHIYQGHVGVRELLRLYIIHLDARQVNSGSPSPAPTAFTSVPTPWPTSN